MKIPTKLLIFLAVIMSLWLLIFYMRLQACLSQSAGEEADGDRRVDTVQGKETQGRPKPVVLLWSWPLGVRFHFGSCLDSFHVDECSLTDDRSLYRQADAVIFFHRNPHGDMPLAPRPPFQKWIWYHVESPTNTARTGGMENLFNLTLSYRRDADITVRNELTIRGPETSEPFVLPEKDKLVCWIVTNNNPSTGTALRTQYYQQLAQYVQVHLFGQAFTGQFLPYEDYYPTIGSCKFYLAFENSIHRDYITEKVNGPLVAGTVPVVMGPPRENYEQFLPAESFIHVDDFQDPESLAEFLLHLDQNQEEYMRYFDWREFYTATPHLLSQKNEFIQPICLACKHMATDSHYRVKHDIYKWYWE